MRTSSLVWGLLTLLAGFAIGVPAFIDYASGQSGMYIDMLMNAADRGENPMRSMAVGMNALALFTFLLLTPLGLLTLYLSATGFVRTVSAWFDDPRGDPVLSGIRWLARWAIYNRRDRRERRVRRTLEGPETRDIVVSGPRAMLPDADLVIIASRRKPGWERDAIVITASATYRIGEIVERTIEGHLRTLYPLTEHKDLEAFRRTVQYDLESKH